MEIQNTAFLRIGSKNGIRSLEKCNWVAVSLSRVKEALAETVV